MNSRTMERSLNQPEMSRTPITARPVHETRFRKTGESGSLWRLANITMYAAARVIQTPALSDARANGASPSRSLLAASPVSTKVMMRIRLAAVPRITARSLPFPTKLRAKQMSHSVRMTAAPAQSMLSHRLRLVPATIRLGLSVSQPSRSEKRPMTDPVTATLSRVTSRRFISSFTLKLNYFKNPFEVRYSLATSVAFCPSTAILALSVCRVSKSKDSKTGPRILAISGYWSIISPRTLGAGS